MQFNQDTEKLNWLLNYIIKHHLDIQSLSDDLLTLDPLRWEKKFEEKLKENGGENIDDELEKVPKTTHWLWSYSLNKWKKDEEGEQTEYLKEMDRC